MNRKCFSENRRCPCSNGLAANETTDTLSTPLRREPKGFRVRLAANLYYPERLFAAWRCLSLAREIGFTGIAPGGPRLQATCEGISIPVAIEGKRNSLELGSRVPSIRNVRHDKRRVDRRNEVPKAEPRGRGDWWRSVGVPSCPIQGCGFPFAFDRLFLSKTMEGVWGRFSLTFRFPFGITHGGRA